jgi:hypothetical protein
MLPASSAPPHARGLTWSTSYPGHAPRVILVDGQGWVLRNVSFGARSRRILPFESRCTYPGLLEACVRCDELAQVRWWCELEVVRCVVEELLEECRGQADGTDGAARPTASRTARNTRTGEAYRSAGHRPPSKQDDPLCPTHVPCATDAATWSLRVRRSGQKVGLRTTMTSEWWYALKRLPVDPAAGTVAATMTLRKHTGSSRREGPASLVPEDSVEGRLDRIVHGLRARVTEPELLEQNCGLDDDPSKPN